MFHTSHTSPCVSWKESVGYNLEDTKRGHLPRGIYSTLPPSEILMDPDITTISREIPREWGFRSVGMCGEGIPQHFKNPETETIREYYTIPTLNIVEFFQKVPIRNCHEVFACSRGSKRFKFFLDIEIKMDPEAKKRLGSPSDFMKNGIMGFYLIQLVKFWNELLFGTDGGFEFKLDNWKTRRVEGGGGIILKTGSTQENTTQKHSSPCEIKKLKANDFSVGDSSDHSKYSAHISANFIFCDNPTDHYELLKKFVVYLFNSSNYCENSKYLEKYEEIRSSECAITTTATTICDILVDLKEFQCLRLPYNSKWASTRILKPWDFEKNMIDQSDFHAEKFKTGMLTYEPSGPILVVKCENDCEVDSKLLSILPKIKFIKRRGPEFETEPDDEDYINSSKRIIQFFSELFEEDVDSKKLLPIVKDLMVRYYKQYNAIKSCEKIDHGRTRITNHHGMIAIDVFGGTCCIKHTKSNGKVGGHTHEEKSYRFLCDPERNTIHQLCFHTGCNRLKYYSMMNPSKPMLDFEELLEKRKRIKDEKLEKLEEKHGNVPLKKIIPGEGIDWDDDTMLKDLDIESDEVIIERNKTKRSPQKIEAIEEYKNEKKKKKGQKKGQKKETPSSTPKKKIIRKKHSILDEIVEIPKKHNLPDNEPDYFDQLDALDALDAPNPPIMEDLPKKVTKNVVRKFKQPDPEPEPQIQIEVAFLDDDDDDDEEFGKGSKHKEDPSWRGGNKRKNIETYDFIDEED